MLSRRLLHLAVAALAAPASLAAQQIAAQPDPARGAFLMIAGTDTVAVERFARFSRPGGDSIAVDLRLGTTGPRLLATVIDSGGLVPRFTAEQSTPGAAAAPRLTIRFTADSAVVDVGGRQQRVAAPAGTLPWVNPMFTLVDQIVQRARTLGHNRVTVPMINAQGAKPFEASVEPAGSDSMVVTFPDVVMRVAIDRDGHVSGARITGQNLVIVRTAALPDPAPTPAAAPTDYSAPAGAPYVAEDVTLRAADGATLAGTFTRPSGLAAGQRVPAVILLTGSGAQDRDEAISVIPGYRPFRQIADTLGRRGIAVLRFDDRGVGGSTGASPEMTMQTLAGDVRTALAWLRARPDIDPARLALLGHSEGAVIAPLVAADDTAVRALVLLGAPSSTGRATSDRQVREAIARLMPDSTAAARERAFAANSAIVDTMAARSAYVRSYFSVDPLTAARRVRQPVLILQGATDTQVPPAEAKVLAEALKKGGDRDVTLRVFPATDHLFLPDSIGEAGPDAKAYAALPTKLVRPEVLGAIADWLAKKLK